MKEKLRKKLLYLRERHGVVVVKGGTEVEDMSFKELKVLKELSRGIVPMLVKIGGPEARNDIRFCLKEGIEWILAPMIESDYGLNNFVKAVKELAGDNIYETYLAMNLETITGYYNINQIIKSAGFKYIKQVTIGRGDLSESMSKGVDSVEVENVVQDIVKRIRNEQRLSSVGGKIDPLNATRIKDTINPHKINTRHIGIDISKTKNLSLSICESLSFEIELYKLLMSVESEKHDSYMKRKVQTKQRIEQRDFILSKSK